MLYIHLKKCDWIACDDKNKLFECAHINYLVPALDQLICLNVNVYSLISQEHSIFLISPVWKSQKFYNGNLRTFFAAVRFTKDPHISIVEGNNYIQSNKKCWFSHGTQLH